jgi:uncharacterized protein (DUF2126 family)
MSCRSSGCSGSAARPAARAWYSEKWKLRRGALFAVPGDSALGYRLPLNSLPYVPPAPIPISTRATPPNRANRWPISAPGDRARGADARALTQGELSRSQPQAAPGHRTAPPGPSGRVEQTIAIEGAVRTAITVEPKGDHLCVFIPRLKRWKTIST